jgi:hypothetical protein
LKLLLGKKILLFATSVTSVYWDKMSPPHLYDSFENFEIYEKLIDLFCQKDDCLLVFKFRPMDLLIEATKKIFMKKKATNVKIFVDQLENLLVACDAVFILQSNVGIGALYYDIQILQYDHPYKKKYITFDLRKCGSQNYKPS